MVAGGGAFFGPFLFFFWLRGPGMVFGFERSWHEDLSELSRWRCRECRGRGRGRPQRCRPRDARRCRDQGASAGVGADASVTVTLANRHQLARSHHDRLSSAADGQGRTPSWLSAQGHTSYYNITSMRHLRGSSDSLSSGLAHALPVSDSQERNSGTIPGLFENDIFLVFVDQPRVKL